MNSLSQIPPAQFKTTLFAPVYANLLLEFDANDSFKSNNKAVNKLVRNNLSNLAPYNSQARALQSAFEGRIRLAADAMINKVGLDALVLSLYRRLHYYRDALYHKASDSIRIELERRAQMANFAHVALLVMFEDAHEIVHHPDMTVIEFKGNERHLINRWVLSL